MKLRKYYRGKDKLSKLGFDGDFNTIKIRSPKEDPLHLILKATISKILEERKRNWATEIKIGNAIIDVVDLDEELGYEVQKIITEKWKKQILKYPIDVIPIKLDEYKALNTCEIYSKLSKHVV